MHFFIVVRTESLHRGKRGARGLTLGLTYPSGCLPICQGCFMWLKTIWLRVTINPNLHSGTPVICRQTRKCIKVFQFRVQGFICFFFTSLNSILCNKKSILYFWTFFNRLVCVGGEGVPAEAKKTALDPWTGITGEFLSAKHLSRSQILYTQQTKQVTPNAGSEALAFQKDKWTKEYGTQYAMNTDMWLTAHELHKMDTCTSYHG